MMTVILNLSKIQCTTEQCGSGDLMIVESGGLSAHHSFIHGSFEGSTLALRDREYCAARCWLGQASDVSNQRE
jgi:hypothetical protein